MLPNPEGVGPTRFVALVTLFDDSPIDLTLMNPILPLAEH
jgi:hypothetical protein